MDVTFAPGVYGSIVTFRIGIFFLFIGLISMWVYFATDIADNPAFWLFFAALGMIILGIYLMRRGYKPPEPSGRFRLLRRNRKKEPEKKDEAS